jgi:hypothetical protein
MKNLIKTKNEMVGIIVLFLIIMLSERDYLFDLNFLSEVIIALIQLLLIIFNVIIYFINKERSNGDGLIYSLALFFLILLLVEKYNIYYEIWYPNIIAIIYIISLLLLNIFFKNYKTETLCHTGILFCKKALIPSLASTVPILSTIVVPAAVVATTVVATFSSPVPGLPSSSPVRAWIATSCVGCGHSLA